MVSITFAACSSLYAWYAGTVYPPTTNRRYVAKLSPEAGERGVYAWMEWMLRVLNARQSCDCRVLVCTRVPESMTHWKNQSSGNS